MKPSEAKGILPLITAFAEGGTIQCYRPKGGKMEWEDATEIKIEWPIGYYRIKPIPKWLVWDRSNVDSLPIDTIYRVKDIFYGGCLYQAFVCMNYSEYGIILRNHVKIFDISYYRLCEDGYEYSTDHEKTWKRCATEIV